MPFLSVSKREWQKAHAFFNQPSNHEMKLSRKDDITRLGFTKKVRHSFIKIKDVIYAIARKKYLGKGSYGRVKLAQTENGKYFAIKVQNIIKTRRMEFYAQQIERINKELKILKRVKGPDKKPLYKGHTIRALIEPKSHSGRLISHKCYGVTTFIEGKNLKNHPLIGAYASMHAYRIDCKFSPHEKLNIALRITQELDKLHKINILHGDLKPDNMMYYFAKDQLRIQIIDFGLSFQLKKKHYFSKRKQSIDNLDFSTGAQYYRSPEAKTKGHFSRASDIYSLGIIFSEDLQLPGIFYYKMLDATPEHRPSCDEVLVHLSIEKANLELQMKQTAMIIENIVLHYQQELNFDVLVETDIEGNQLKLDFKDFDVNIRARGFYHSFISMLSHIDLAYKQINDGIIELQLDMNHSILEHKSEMFHSIIQDELLKFRQIEQFFQNLQQSGEQFNTNYKLCPLVVLFGAEYLKEAYTTILTHQQDYEREMFNNNYVLIKRNYKSRISIEQKYDGFHLILHNQFNKKSIEKWKMDDFPPQLLAQPTLRKSPAFESFTDFIRLPTTKGIKSIASSSAMIDKCSPRKLYR